MHNTIRTMESLNRSCSMAAAEIADERIDAERVAWLRTMIGDYERLYRMHEDDDVDPDGTATMLREMWGMCRGLEKIHCQDVPEVAVDVDNDLPL